jgi:hypothetical protein
LEHVPPPGTHGVRAYGLYAAGKRTLLDRAREALGQPPALTWQGTWIAGDDADPTRCTVCGRPLICTATVPPAYRPAGRRRPPPAEVYYARAA